MIKAMLGDMIKKRENAMQNGEPFGDDLLGLLLQCKENIDNEMTTEDVIEECKLFYFAGQETTANWLTWTIIVLSMHQDWQDKAREEVLHVYGKNKTPDHESLNHLKIVSSNYKSHSTSVLQRMSQFLLFMQINKSILW